jgi:hypothetical protein
MLVFARLQRSSDGYPQPSDIAVYKDGSVQPVPNSAGCELPIFQPRGTGVVSVCNGSDIVASDLDGGNRRVLVRDAADGAPTWLVSDIEFAPDDAAFLITIFNLNRGWVNYGFKIGESPTGPFNASSTDGWTGIPRFGSDGVNLLAWGCDPCGSRDSGPGHFSGALLRVGRSGEVLESLTQVPSSVAADIPGPPIASPDGSAVAYAASTSVNGSLKSSILVTSLADGSTHTLADGSAPDWQPISVSVAPPPKQYLEDFSTYAPGSLPDTWIPAGTPSVRPKVVSFGRLRCSLPAPGVPSTWWRADRQVADLPRDDLLGTFRDR